MLFGGNGQHATLKANKSKKAVNEKPCSHNKKMEQKGKNNKSCKKHYKGLAATNCGKNSGHQDQLRCAKTSMDDLCFVPDADDRLDAMEEAKPRKTKTMIDKCIQTISPANVQLDQIFNSWSAANACVPGPRQRKVICMGDTYAKAKQPASGSVTPIASTSTASVASHSSSFSTSSNTESTKDETRHSMLEEVVAGAHLNERTYDWESYPISSSLAHKTYTEYNLEESYEHSVKKLIEQLSAAYSIER